ncbi:hypothetical protein PIB30_109549, partial [Stylosanthes scabra]|nr:hypothetical protein [Stylosanthes scabra]
MDDDAAASTNDGDGVGAPGHHPPLFSLGSCPPLSQSPCSTTATGEDSAVTVGITGSEAQRRQQPLAPFLHRSVSLLLFQLSLSFCLSLYSIHDGDDDDDSQPRRRRLPFPYSLSV